MQSKQQSIRRFDSAVVKGNGLEFKRWEVGKTSWNSTALAQVSGNDSYKMKRMEWIERHYREKIKKLCERNLGNKGERSIKIMLDEQRKMY